MNIEQLLDVVEYSIVFYKDSETNAKFSLYEYYSITDISPKELANIALEYRRPNTCRTIRGFDSRHHWNQKEVNMPQKLALCHAVNNQELTVYDKLTIRDQLVEEGFPVITGVYDIACRHYAMHGVEGISKENTKNKVVESYFYKNGRPCNIQTNTTNKQKQLVK